MPKRPKPAPSQPPPIGDVYAVPLADGRFGACRVIDIPPPGRHFGDARYAAATAYIADAPPASMDHPDLRRLLVLTHHVYGQQPPKVLGAWLSDPPPAGYARLGAIEPTDAERDAEVHNYVAWTAIAQGILAEWRWHHDRDAVLAEDAARAAELEQQRAQYDRAKAAMTFATFRKQKLFPDWREPTPQKMVAAARNLLKETAAKLEALGPRADRRKARAILRDCVVILNKLDEENDHWIETIEREDLCEAIDLLARLAGFADADDFAGEWRDW